MPFLLESDRQQSVYSLSMADAGTRGRQRTPHRARHPVNAKDHKSVEEMSIDRVLSRREVAAILGISLPTLWRQVKRGALPAPFRISPGRVGWRASVILRWLADRSDGVN